MLLVVVMHHRFALVNIINLQKVADLESIELSNFSQSAISGSTIVMLSIFFYKLELKLE